MPVNAIPFRMPAPVEIPAHLVSMLRHLPPDQALRRAMELLLQIEAGEILIFEKVDAKGRLQLAEVVCPDPEEAGRVREALAGEECYGQALAPAGLAGRALEAGNPLLVMGQLGQGEESPLTPRLGQLLAGRGGGNVGFVYVLPIGGGGQTPLGALTLVRGAGAGPLNHEQPGLTEGMRQVLADILSG
ncbi:MAG: hypothetical protein FJY95_19750 [Candidatus Handelsmanbacteria bacterium]|nr:hypothetical protein [Candidatus Handelsmanbacteria bacterium]